MNNCSIVIGSFYGDEGKGHMTDIICSKEKDTLNVRFNGGAQASHTVQNTDGTRHAFRHFGSGTFSGATTYLSSDFIVNPVAFVLEADELKKKFDLDACAIVNPKAIVTIPWDMYINQIVERYRKGNRHGSCGFGINETILRNKNPKYRITVEDLIYERNLIYKMFLIRDEYIKSHLKDEYGLDFESIEDRSKFECKDEINMFVFYAKEFLSRVHIKGDSVFKDFKNVVFEGAQGLLLDKDNTQNFPHVTPSKTGITNVLNTLSLNEDLYDGNINIYYMSRCYITRHGAGPLKNELEKAPYSKICDLTNIENEFQGKLRYAYLDLDQLIQNINDDLMRWTMK